MTVTLHEHQAKAVDKLDNGKVLLGGVGSGKTITSLAYYMKNEAPKDLYVITTAKKRDDLDWIREAALFGIGKGRGPRTGAITVDSWNNIAKYKEVKDAFFIFDEQRLVGTGSWAKAFLGIAKRNRWVLLSATPGDTWEDYTALFVANRFFKNQTHYKTKHMVYSYYGGYPKLERYIDEATLEKLRKSILVEMDYVPHTRRHIHNIPVDYPAKQFKEIVSTRFNPETDEPFMGIADLIMYLRKLVNSDPSRKDELISIIEKAKKVIVFYNYDYELEILRTLGEKYPIAEWNGHKHEEIPKGDTWVYLVQYTAGSEGWNCTRTNVLVFYSMTYSYKQYEQAQGRIDRMNTPYTDLHYFVLRSASSVDRTIANALKNKRNFNERAYVKSLI